MLRISKLADYGTVIMSYLALHPSQVFSATELAQKIQLSTPTVSKILKILSEANLVVSTRGAGGGYQLAKPAVEVSIADIITAIEGLPTLTECCQASNLCSQDTVCGVKGNWQVVNRFILNALRNLTLADMAKPLSLTVLNDKIKFKPVVMLERV